MSAHTTAERRRRVGYVLKGYPRISETFVASELIELERLGERGTEFIGIAPYAADAPPYFSPLNTGGHRSHRVLGAIGAPATPTELAGAGLGR